MIPRDPWEFVAAALSLRLPAAETMLRLNPRQRAALSETFRELANLVAAALVIGQVVAEQPPSLWLILMGFGIWVGFVWFGVLLEGD